MKKLALFIVGLNILTILFADTSCIVDIHPYSLDEFFRDNPEYVPETIMIDVRLPEVQLNNEIVNIIMEKDLLAKLKRYKSSGKILLSLGGFPQANYCIYAFEPVTPIQSISNIEVVNDSIANIVGYLQYDDVYILLNDYFLNEISQRDTTKHNFKLKLLKQIWDERCEWVYIISDSIIRGAFCPETNFKTWYPEVREMMKRMDEHDF